MATVIPSRSSRTGRTVFTAGGKAPALTAGRIVVGPANTPHGFRRADADLLRVVSVHPSPTVQQTDL